jgi:hypothetical protein
MCKGPVAGGHRVGSIHGCSQSMPQSLLWDHPGGHTPGAAPLALGWPPPIIGSAVYKSPLPDFQEPTLSLPHTQLGARALSL